MKHITGPKKLKANLSQAKLLIIEDNDDHWVFIKYAMQQCLPEVTSCRVATPQKALDQLNQWEYEEGEHPKLIVLDLYLPEDGDGWQILQAIKQLPAPLSQIPVVMFSSSEAIDDIVKAYELGVASYLVKPDNATDWLAYIQQLRDFWWEKAILPRPGFSM